MQIGYESSGSVNFLWTKMHDGGEYRLLIGNGNELVAVNMKIVYKISDLYSYVTKYSNPEAVLSAAAYEVIMHRTVSNTLDTFLSVDRSTLSAFITEEISKFCESEKLGLSVIQVIVESIHPPVEIAGVYQRVVSALIDKNTLIMAAKTKAEKNIIEAEQQSKVVVDNAKATQHKKISAAEKEMAIYYAAMEAHKVNPESFELTKYLNTYETVIKGNKLYVFSPGTENSIPDSVIGRLNTVNIDSIKKTTP
jgi:regulator of protease activity HflC (stomatin/prohibitin superfamily)